MQNCWEEESFKEIVEKCTEIKDLRIGLYLMKEAGALAEERSSRRITLFHVAEASKKVDDFHIKPTEGLDEGMQFILNLIKDNSGEKIGDIFSKYAEQGGDMSYKSFQRRILKLSESRFINTEKISGNEGNTTKVFYSGERKLTEF